MADILDLMMSKANGSSEGGDAFARFCGDLGPFWDSNLTWYTGNPDVTQCFQNTVLLWVPCGWLLLLAPGYMYYMSQARGRAIPSNKLSSTKFISSLLLAMLWLVQMTTSWADQSNDPQPPLPLVVTPAVMVVTMLVSGLVILQERWYGFITSGILFIYWLLHLISGVIIFQSKVKEATREGHVSDSLRYTSFFIHFGLVSLQWVLCCFTERPPPAGRGEPQPGKVCPEARASFLSRITFWWMNSIVFTGYKKTLTEADIWSLNPRDVSAKSARKFDKAWANEVQKSARKHRKQTRSHRGSLYTSIDSTEFDEESTPLITSQSHDTGSDASSKTTPAKGSVLRAIARVFGFTLLQAHLCKLVCDVLTFTGPMLQKELIAFVEKNDGVVMEEWKGYLFAAMFFVTAIANSFFFHQLYHIGMTLGMRIKASLIAAVYKKALTMNSEAYRTSTVGEIVNLMSVDAQRMQDVTGFVWMVWSCPLQISVSIYMLWGIVGPSVLAGVGVMVLMVPVNAFMATLQRKLQLRQMKLKDERIKLMNEVLNGMKVLKLYAWEPSFQEKVTGIREQELKTLRKYAFLQAAGSFTWTCTPFLITLATFVTYVLMGGTLDAQKAFVSLSLFNILRFPITLLPMMVSYIVTASVSLKRLGRFLEQGDIDFDNVQRDASNPYMISITNGTFAWGRGKDDATVLKGINLTLDEGQLMAVVGRVGEGKSSLISAILGEMEKISGHVNVKGSVAYVAQQAWIQNATVRANILFGKEFNQEKYDAVLEACALLPDLEILTAGDQTEIGEKGINLSGGQKQRVSLARAVYSDSDIYLLDDPLSAVDSHVGKHIFEKVISDSGLLRGKTRILVTHGVHWLPSVSNIVVLVNGAISEMGSYDELMSHNAAFAQFLKQHLLQENGDSSNSDPEIEEVKAKILQRLGSLSGDDNVTKMASDGRVTSGTDGATSDSKSKGPRRRRQSSVKGPDKAQLIKSVDKAAAADGKTLDKKPSGTLVEKEKEQVGKVSLNVFMAYGRALGIMMVSVAIFFFAMYMTISVLSSVWLSVWTQDPLLKNTSIPVTNPEYVHQRDMYLGVYGGMGLLQAAFVLIYSVNLAICSVRASRVMHFNMLKNILRSPMAFFETTPTGRILNRFSRDVETVDNTLPQLFRSWVNTTFTVISTIVVISYSTPIFLVMIVPLAILYYFIQRFYIPTSRQLKRIESTTRSPIYVHFSETVTGASTIRAYNVQHRFITTSMQQVDHNLVFYFSSIASNRWLGIRLELIGAFIVLSAALFAVLSRGSVNSGVVGLSITYALQITQSLNWMVRMTSDLETNIVSVERIKEYSETPTEAQWDIEETRPAATWPDEGRVAFEDYATRYRPGLDLVLRGISFSIKSEEKVGIVGRTGAGKSSMTLSLFRVIESVHGSIVIDGIPIHVLGLHQLRTKLTILPQDPVLFSGSLRMNLDPIDRHLDYELWEALEHAHLKAFVESLPAQLDHECGEGGQNLSVGQRQLICLARALLHKTKILILDEATAAVDLETDELIQNTIRSEFATCTVITIAHRLNTIMDSDRVMVLDAGNVIEFAEPQKLLKDKKTVFYSMAKDAGLVT